PEGFPREALGTPISASLAAQLAAIDLTAVTPTAELTTVVNTGRSAELDKLAQHLGSPPTTRWISMAGSAAWNSDAALNAATVPMDIVQALVSRIEETIP
ncbi:MAG TPA: hypothetical protein PKU97_08930, partial [Kofleriaceae bacterium]|nr:hypothetical protein [Kofleriaceae bacterium]